MRITDTKEVLRRIKDLGLLRFIRTKEEINKEAMITERAIAESIEGVSISRREDFVVRPIRSASEVIKKIRLKKISEC